ncbi:MAG: PhoPQ-activated protein PqaA family protein, partial [Pirellulaceae bacterium]
QRATWGTTSEQINDYSQRGLTEKLETPAARHLRDIVDPYSYRQRLVQPKLIILGTNELYWPLDALNLYWDQLNGPKYVMYVPNNGHGIRDIARVTGSLAALYQHTAAGRDLPQLDWKFAEQDGELRLRVTADQVPVRVDTWTAFSATKDFRDAKWTARPAHPDGDGHVCQLARPTSGYAAMFGELVFDGARLPYFLSTNVRIIGAAAGGE